MVRPVGGDSLVYRPSDLNVSMGNVLPDSLLISMQMPPEVQHSDLGDSHKEEEDVANPPRKLYTYYFGGAFTGKISIPRSVGL